MTPLEAVRAIKEVERTDQDLALAVTHAVMAKGCKDLYTFAERFPDEVVMMAEQIVDVYEQAIPEQKGRYA